MIGRKGKYTSEVNRPYNHHSQGCIRIEVARTQYIVVSRGKPIRIRSSKLFIFKKKPKIVGFNRAHYNTCRFKWNYNTIYVLVLSKLSLGLKIIRSTSGFSLIRIMFIFLFTFHIYNITRSFKHERDPCRSNLCILQTCACTWFDFDLVLTRREQEDLLLWLFSTLLVFMSSSPTDVHLFKHL